MSMQISVDPSGLTTEQREAVADFILTYPNGKSLGTLTVDVTADTSKLKSAIAEIGDSTATVDLRVPQSVAAAVAANPDGARQALEEEVAHLAREGGEFEASVAFSGATHTDPAAAAAFGSAPGPLTQAAPAAPFTAAAAPSSTAPAAMPATTSAATLSVPAPPAPNTANVAQAAALPTGSPAAGVALDSKGLPWDARIHVESKNTIADGSWRKKRNLDPTLLATVEAELRALMSAPGAPNAFASSPTHAAGVAGLSTAPAAAVPLPTAPSVGNVPPPPGYQAAPPAIPSATAASPQTALPAASVPALPVDNTQDPRAMFVALVGRASAAIQGGKVTQAEINQCCADVGVPALPLLANRLDLVAQVVAKVDQLIVSRG